MSKMTKMEKLPKEFSFTNEDKENLKQIVDAFGSAVSLDEIAATYSRADRDLIKTVEVLYKSQGRSSSGSSLASQDDLESKTSVSSENETCKPKKCSASVGSVSSVIGREYSRHRYVSNESSKKNKPLKVNSRDFPASVIWDEKSESDFPSRSDTMHADIEQFLFKMLGDGFQLKMDVIQDVVGQCGYDMQMSMDKLLDLSAPTLGQKDDINGSDIHQRMGNDPELEDIPFKGQIPEIAYYESDTSGSEIQLPRRKKNKHDLQKEVLQSLFGAPERIEEKPQRTQSLGERRRQLHNRWVVKPIQETTEDITFITRRPVRQRGDEFDENSYEELRKAVKEYWGTMREYYKAAVDAFAKQELEKAQKFVEQGHFFMKKAREVEEASAQMLILNSSEEEEEEISFNLHYFDPKEAVDMLKLHLASFAGLPSFQHLKIVVGTDKKDSKEKSRKRLSNASGYLEMCGITMKSGLRCVIIKLLNEESIPFTEDETGKIISIRANEIDPEKLSFAN